MILEVTKEAYIKVEYAFNGEKTGGFGDTPAKPGPGSVANDALLVDLLLEF